MVGSRIFALALLVQGCAGSTQVDARASSRRATLRVVEEPGGAALYDGAATYVWRRDERVAALPGLGELSLGDVRGDGGCRLVVSHGLRRLVVLEAAACGTRVEGGRVCLSGARLVRGDADPDPGPRRVLVEGCVEEGDLLWRKVDEAAPASVGPIQFHRSCAPVDAPRRCPVEYLRIDELVVEGNPEPMRGAALSYEDDVWSVCWLEPHRGEATVSYTMRTACDDAPRARRLVRERRERP